MRGQFGPEKRGLFDRNFPFNSSHITIAHIAAREVWGSFPFRMKKKAIRRCSVFEFRFVFTAMERKEF